MVVAKRFLPACFLWYCMNSRQRYSLHSTSFTIVYVINLFLINDSGLLKADDTDSIAFCLMNSLLSFFNSNAFGPPSQPVKIAFSFGSCVHQTGTNPSEKLKPILSFSSFQKASSNSENYFNHSTKSNIFCCIDIIRNCRFKFNIIHFCFV